MERLIKLVVKVRNFCVIIMWISLGFAVLPIFYFALNFYYLSSIKFSEILLVSKNYFITFIIFALLNIVLLYTYEYLQLKKIQSRKK